MRLPSLSVIIASQAIVWCVAGAMIHKWKILLYPISWIAVASAFYFHYKRYPIKLPAPTIPSDETWANSRKNASEDTPEKVVAD